MSDTHSYLDDKVLTYFKDVDEIWHAGDIGAISVTDRLSQLKPVRGVFGNIDNAIVQKEFPLNNRFMCEGVDVWITHIGGYPPKYNSRTRPEIQQNPPKLFICGHSHILKVMMDKKHGTLHMNPGACGKHGFHIVRTMLRFEIDGPEIKNLDVIELGKR